MNPGFDHGTLIRQRIVRTLRDLPPLPAAVMRVVKETDDPNCSATTIEKIILTDQALTAQVLRVVNSAYYGMSAQVSSVSQAIMILGLQQVRNLALSVAAISTFAPTSARQRETLSTFWRHSFATAATTQLIRDFKRLPARTAEAMFVGGLLHDIGRLFLFVNFTQAYDQVIDRAAREEVSLETAELALLGMSHAAVGEHIATQWKFPPHLVAMIGNHEGPFDETTPVESLVVHLADAINKPYYFTSIGKANFEIDPFAAEWFGVDVAAYQSMAVEIAHRVDEMSASFGIAA